MNALFLLAIIFAGFALNLGASWMIMKILIAALPAGDYSWHRRKVAVLTSTLALLVMVPALALAGGGSSGPDCGGSTTYSKGSSPDCGGGATGTGSSNSSNDDADMDCGGPSAPPAEDEPMCGKPRHSNFALMAWLVAAVVATLLTTRWLNNQNRQPPKPDEKIKIKW